MSEISDVVVPILQQIQALLSRMEERIDRLIDDVQDLKVRVTHVEEGLAGINRRLDRMDQRVERIERRLDLVDAWIPVHGSMPEMTVATRFIAVIGCPRSSGW